MAPARPVTVYAGQGTGDRLPEVTDGQRRHNRRTANVPDQDIARAHRQAQDITKQWLEADWHPALTGRWHDRHRRLAATIPGPGAVLADMITHPEMLAVARLLILRQRAPGAQPRRPRRPCPPTPPQRNRSLP